MAFEVLITEQAFDDLDAITRYIKENSSLERARKWFTAIVVIIGTLQELPARRPLAEESERSRPGSSSPPARAQESSLQNLLQHSLRHAANRLGASLSCPSLGPEGCDHR